MPHCQRSDAALLHGIAQGNETALLRLYDRHITKLLALAYSILDDLFYAHEAVHEVFLDIWHQPQTYEPRYGTVSCWLLLKLREHALGVLHEQPDIVQQKQPRSFLGHQIPHSSHRNQNYQQQHMRHALESLPKIMRKVLELAYFRAYSIVEISQILGIPVETVRHNLLEASQLLQDTQYDLESPACNTIM